MSGGRDTSYFTWFRFYHDMLGTTAVRQLDDHELRVLIACMTLASRSPEADRLEGALAVNPTGEPVSVRFIAAEVWTSDEPTVSKTLKRLETKGLMRTREDGAHVVAFKWQQYATDTSTPRTRKYRQKQKQSAEEDASPSMPEQSKQQQTRTEQSKGERSPERSHDGGDQCPDCDGIGTVNGDTCAWCGGSGRV